MGEARPVLGEPGVSSAWGLVEGFPEESWSLVGWSAPIPASISEVVAGLIVLLWTRMIVQFRVGLWGEPILMERQRVVNSSREPGYQGRLGLVWVMCRALVSERVDLYLISSRPWLAGVDSN
jgi:hypothetical protein